MPSDVTRERIDLLRDWIAERWIEAPSRSEASQIRNTILALIDAHERAVSDDERRRQVAEEVLGDADDKIVCEARAESARLAARCKRLAGALEAVLADDHAFQSVRTNTLGVARAALAEGAATGAEGEWPDADVLAQQFHEAYERLAPSFGYETREASAKPWSEVPENNRRLMIAVCGEILDGLGGAEGEWLPAGEVPTEPGWWLEVVRAKDGRSHESCIHRDQRDIDHYQRLAAESPMWRNERRWLPVPPPPAESGTTNCEHCEEPVGNDRVMFGGNLYCDTGCARDDGVDVDAELAAEEAAELAPAEVVEEPNEYPLCPECGADETSYQGRDGTKWLWECVACAHDWYTAPPPGQGGA